MDIHSYTEAGNELMGNINPEFSYNASVNDPSFMKRKVVKGGSWKDIATFIRADTRDGNTKCWSLLHRIQMCAHHYQATDKPIKGGCI